ncbi:serine/threonine protein kinase [Streptosporangium sp. NBC_01495]|uniref:serine/threonine-protein kinase n=1 Tax=Streptosporangium sp. NBC_01495 TaxID=2903899 RepID=UPI002E2FF7BF|nr:serine/threonine-protein kinase [Streptosporangium sp. NBC_01495]
MTAYGLPPVLGLEPSDPTVLGPYRIAGRLGKGGMGTVYLAEGASGPVAIKVINTNLAADPEFVARFKNEVAAARKVSRFCTAPVLDARLEGEPLWVVTEYVAGPDLARMLRDHGTLSGANLEGLAVGVALALTAIHGAGIVHRDLKPANVLLSPLGPRVIDFGIARALDANGGQTSTGRVIGTPDYMAPERFSGGTSGPPADIFAWGCVVVAAATGKSPFAARSMPEVLFRVPDLEDLEPGLRDLVRASLDKDPAARPTAQNLVSGLAGRNNAEDTAKLADTLRLNLFGLLPPTVRVTDPAEREAGRTPPWFRRRPVVVGGAAAGALLLAVAAVIGIRALPQGPPVSTDVLYRDDFGNDRSGWFNEGTRVDTSRGYTGDGRYTLATDTSNGNRWVDAPVNAEPPERALVTVRINITGGTSWGAWTGVTCDYKLDDEHLHYYTLEIRPDGRARIRKTTSVTAWDMTSDLLTPAFSKEKATLRAECSRDGGEVRLALWVDDRLVAEAVDEDAGGAKGRPRFGLTAGKFPGNSTETRVYFDDFEIGRLP